MSHTWSEFWRELHADIKGNPILAIGAAASAAAAGYGIWEVGTSLPDVGVYTALVLAATFEVAMIGLAWEARRKLVSGQRIKSILWAVVGLIFAGASSWFATSVGIIEHGEGVAGWIRVAFPLVAFASVHVLFLSSVEERQHARAREEEERRAAAVSRMLDAAKATKFATLEERPARLAELHTAQSEVRGLGAGIDVLAITNAWVQTDAQIDASMRTVADRAASWLDDEAPKLLAPAAEDTADEETDGQDASDDDENDVDDHSTETPDAIVSTLPRRRWNQIPEGERDLLTRQMTELYYGGATYKEIAPQVGFSEHTVGRVLRAAGVTDTAGEGIPVLSAVGSQDA